MKDLGKKQNRTLFNELAAKEQWSGEETYVPVCLVWFGTVTRKHIRVDSVGAFILEKQILKGGSIMGKSQPFQQNLCRTGFYHEYEENSPKPLSNISALSEDRKTFVGN